jgi:hypothetical protein
MAKDMPPSSEWSAKRIRAMLKKQAASSKGGVAANVFFDGSVPGDQLADRAKEAIDQAARRIKSSAKVEVGKVHQLAKSVAVSGDPDVIAELSNLDSVKSILPSEIGDIYPKPVRRKPIK